MPKKTEVPITGTVLAWAIDQAGFTPATLAEKVKVSPVTVEAWIAETEAPGKTEFAKLVDQLRRPSAIFFMATPPVAAGIPTSFRRAPGRHAHEVSPAALRELRKARRIQQVVSWLMDGETSAHVRLPAFNRVTTSAAEAGAMFRAQLGISLFEQASWKDPGAALRNWRQIFDERDVLTFSLQLGKDDIRGFSAWDERAPIVAVNTAYNEGARIFTMAHELGHLLTRTDSSCYSWINPDEDIDHSVERWCEQFAASFLLPRQQLRDFMQQAYGITELNPLTSFGKTLSISRRLKVSARALAISLEHANLAPRSLYLAVDRNAKVVDRPRDTGGGGGGLPTPEKRINQYGSRVSRVVTDAVARGDIGLRDAADYLDVSLGDLQDISTLVMRGGR